MTSSSSAHNKHTEANTCIRVRPTTSQVTLVENCLWRLQHTQMHAGLIVDLIGLGEITTVRFIKECFLEHSTASIRTGMC